MTPLPPGQPHATNNHFRYSYSLNIIFIKVTKTSPQLLLKITSCGKIFEFISLDAEERKKKKEKKIYLAKIDIRFLTVNRSKKKIFQAADEKLKIQFRFLHHW